MDFSSPAPGAAGPPATVRIEHDAAGARLVKEGPPGSAAALQIEAELLARARHPGVVELLDVHVDADGARLVTAFVGSHSLETWTPSDAAHAAGLFAALTETLADLHLVGLAHGRVTGDHVVLDRHGQPRLCGFRAAVVVDPAAPEPRHEDVLAIGVLLDAVLDRLELSPPRRHRRDHRRAVRALRAVAASAQHPDGQRRPSARRLAGAILDAVPDARLLSAAEGAAPWIVHPVTRPSARRLAGANLDAVPDAPLRSAAEGAAPWVVHPVTRPSARRLAGANLDAVPDAQLRSAAEGAAPWVVHPVTTTSSTTSDADVPVPRRPDRPEPVLDGPLDHRPGPARPTVAASDEPRARPRRGGTVATGVIGLVLLLIGLSTVGHGERPVLVADAVLPPSTAAPSAGPDASAAAAGTAPSPSGASPSGTEPSSGAPPAGAARSSEAEPSGAGPSSEAQPPDAEPSRAAPSDEAEPSGAGASSGDDVSSAPHGAGAEPSSEASPSAAASPAGADSSGAAPITVASTTPSAPAPVVAGCSPPARCTSVAVDGTIERGGIRFAIGDPGDEIALGDFTCRGVETPVVLRPATGAVFAFDSWAADGHETTALVRARTDVGAHLIPSPVDHDGCAPLLVQLPSGRTAVVSLASGP